MPDQEEQEEQERQIRPFAAVLQELGRGQVHNDLSEALADVTAAVVAAGKKGSVTLTVTVDTVGKAADNLAVTAQVAARPPKVTPKATVFWSDDAGNLLRHDPRQPALPFRELNTEEKKTA